MSMGEPMISASQGENLSRWDRFCENWWLAWREDYGDAKARKDRAATILFMGIGTVALLGYFAIEMVRSPFID